MKHPLHSFRVPSAVPVKFRSALVAMAAFFAILSRAAAEVRPNSLFSDGAVFQQDVTLPVWGTAGEGENVTVEFDGQTASTIAKDGKWRVQLKPHQTGGPYTLVIKGENTIVVRDVLVGEVWVCSGQSNMTSKLREKNASNPQLRMFTVEQTPSASPAANVEGRWLVCSPETASSFSAVGYYFGRDLHNATGRPVGMIHSSWGGTRVESWISLERLQQDSEFQTYAKSAESLTPPSAEALEKYPVELAAYNAKLVEWNETGGKAYDEAVKAWVLASKQAVAEGNPAPAKPVLAKPRPIAPKPPNGTAGMPTTLFNGMIAPLLPYAIRGVIWYQGESNASNPTAYRKLFPALIADWRTHWGQGDLPFLFVQIAPHKSMPPELREAQFLTWQTTPNTAMAVITDAGDAEDIHPKKKEPVGARLALAARALAYGEKIEYSGPVYDSLKIDRSRAILSFRHTGGGLVAGDGGVHGFSVAGADHVFVEAKAEIENDTVIVSSEKVPAPIAVRYGWANVPNVNLYNREGLPATPFRTDGSEAR
jgi:sialate O-acetylesterase